MIVKVIFDKRNNCEWQFDLRKKSTLPSFSSIFINISIPIFQKLSPAAAKVADQHHQKSHSMNDLLSLDNPSPAAPQEVKHAANSNDLLNFGGVSSVFIILENIIENIIIYVNYF